MPDAGGEVYDPLGGLPDLLARRVRFVGDARARIREDYLRILRFFRFSAEYAEGAFDRDGVAASIRERLGLMRLSRERVRAELLRILVARRAAGAIEVLDESGLLLLILGGVARRRRFERLCAIEAALEARPDPFTVWRRSPSSSDEDAARLAESCASSSQETNDLSGLAARRPDVSGGMDEAALEAALYRLGPRLYLGRLLLSWADFRSAAESDPAWKRAAALVAVVAAAQIPRQGRRSCRERVGARSGGGRVAQAAGGEMDREPVHAKPRSAA